MSGDAGLAAYRRRDYEAAAHAFGEAVETDPADAVAWKGLARSAARLKRTDEALAAAKKLTEVEPGSLRAWMTYGRVAFYSDRDDVALPVWEHIAHLAPTDASAHYALGYLLYGAERYREAGESLGRAVGLRPDFAAAHYLLGYVHLALDDPSSAAAQIRRLRSLDSGLAAELQRAIAPHRQETVVIATVVVVSLWLAAGKWFVPPPYSNAWQIGGAVLFVIAFILYRHFHRQAYPQGIPPNRYWGDREEQ